MLGIVGLRDHIADPGGLRRILSEGVRPYRIEDFVVPIHLVCADLVTGDEVVLSSGPVVDAVIASAAIPGVFPPVAIGDRMLVDGAVAARTPVAVAQALGATSIVVLPCGFACVGRSVPKHALGRAMHAVTLIGARQLRQDFERFREVVNLRIVPPLCPLECSSFDYSQAAALIARSRQSTRQWLASGGLERPGFPHELIEHSH